MFSGDKARIKEQDKGAKESKWRGIDERLFESRTILLSEDVNPKTARRVVELLLAMDAEDAVTPITMLINSPGGEVHSGFAIYDMVRFIRPEVRMVCTGLTASIATVILLAANPGNRLAFPNARLLIHQPLFQGEVFGPASDLEITAGEILKTRSKINELIASATGRDLTKVERDTERDFWLTADEAVEYGMIDRVIRSWDELSQI